MDLLKSLKQELLLFIDSIEDICSEYNISTDEVIYVQVLFRAMSEEQIMYHITKRILPWKKQIVERNESFFYKNKKIFGELPEDKVNYFSDLITKTFSQDDKNEIWDFFDTFITFAEEYKKKQ